MIANFKKTHLSFKFIPTVRLLLLYLYAVKGKLSIYYKCVKKNEHCAFILNEHNENVFIDCALVKLT